MTAQAALPAGLVLRHDADRTALGADLGARFIDLPLGEEGRAFLDRALSERPGRLRTLAHGLLCAFLSDFDANGLLGMYPMHLLSPSQWATLLEGAPHHRHLDVGAGAGWVTRTLTAGAVTTVTTETSRVMARVLRRQGYPCHVLDLATAAVPEAPFDLVTCLNVIDRCARPRSLVERLARALAPGGRLVIATPLPFDPFVYDGPRSVAPDERLEMPTVTASGEPSWEESVVALVREVVTPAGLSVEKLCRAPYLCQGDADAPLYVLDDVVLVCRSAATPRRPIGRSDHPG